MRNKKWMDKTSKFFLKKLVVPIESGELKIKDIKVLGMRRNSHGYFSLYQTGTGI